MTRTQRIAVLRIWLATRLRGQAGRFRTQRQLHAAANLLVMEQVGMEGVVRLTPLIRATVAKMWAAILLSRNAEGSDLRRAA